MHVTLLVIYLVGFGNTAVLTEKFASMDECEVIRKDLIQNVDVKFSECK